MARPKKADEQKQLAPAMQPHPQAAPLPQSVPVAVPVAAAPPPIMNHANRSIDVPNFIRVRDSVCPNPLLLDPVPPSPPALQPSPPSQHARTRPCLVPPLHNHPHNLIQRVRCHVGRRQRRYHCHPALPPSALCQIRPTGVCSHPASPFTCPNLNLPAHLINIACCNSAHEKKKKKKTHYPAHFTACLTSLYYPRTSFSIPTSCT